MSQLYKMLPEALEKSQRLRTEEEKQTKFLNSKEVAHEKENLEKPILYLLIIFCF